MSLVCRDVTVRYGATPVLRGVSLEVEAGGWTTLVGPNGAGKSTLLRAVAGLVEFTGEIRLFGADTRATSRRDVARLVAFVPQRPVLPAAMSVADYVHLGRTPHLGYLERETRHDDEVVGHVLERLELVVLARRRLDEVSGGEAQRAVLARALAQEAMLLVLDEPTTALDLGHQQRVLGLIDELRAERGLTVVSSSHDLVLAPQFADELALVAGGALVATGPGPVVLTAANVERHYGASVGIERDAEGRVVVVPLRPRRPR